MQVIIKGLIIFTFKMYIGENVTTPPQKIPDINAALLMAGHFIKSYSKVEVILHNNVVVKTLTNDTPIFSAQLN